MKYGINGEFEDTEADSVERGVPMKRNNGVSASPEEACNGTPATMASANMSVKTEADAVVFSIQFYGKTIGEVGLMDQDLSELDWKKFKSYLFQNLLSTNHQENICVSYSDDEGDKLPIESEEEYREALKVAKKKAEAHDKLVLDITRQGSLPTVLSLMSSGIKRVSSSPPKEGGASFFKASSLPKEAGFTGRAMGAERKLLPTFLSSERGDGRSRARASGLQKETPQTPPQWFTDYMNKFRDEMSQQVAEKVTEILQEKYSIFHAGVRPQLTEEQVDDLQIKFSRCSLLSQGVYGNLQNDSQRKSVSDAPKKSLPTPDSENKGKKRERTDDYFAAAAALGVKNDLPISNCECKEERNVGIKETPKFTLKSPSGLNLKKQTDKVEVHANDVGAKRKKLIREEERLSRMQEKLEERLARMDEKYVRLKEKLEEKHLKKQERMTEKMNKQQDKAERKKPVTKHGEEMERPNRTQEKVLAKMEGLRKKQTCSLGELSKLRKMVDKQKHRVLIAEQRHQRINERKCGNFRAGKAKRVSIDNKAFPVDASLLHAALQELEALAEDSPSEGASLVTQGFDARYVCDVTFPDGSEVAPGSEFVKIWKVANTGVRTWNEKTTLCKWTQVRFRGSPAGWKLKPSCKKVVCPPLESGEEGSIAITFTAPSEPGWYATHWRFCQRGRVFGNQMWCAVHVVDTPNCDAVVAVPREDTSASALTQVERTVTLRSPFRVSQHMQGLGSVGASDTPGEDSAESEDVELETETTAPCDNSQSDHDSYQVGIVEDYFDAEDPSPQQLIQGVQELSLMDPGYLSEDAAPEGTDLISFEEEAELLGSGSSTPEIISIPQRSNTVSPLKIIAKESVESVKRSKQIEKDKILSAAVRKSCGIEVSDSSGSISELDSEDQAILNESDSEASDYEYYVVHIPECFDLSQPYAGATSSVIKEEFERPDSPDFLTADEDERTTAVACGSPRRFANLQEEDETSTNSSRLTLQSEATRSVSSVVGQESIRVSQDTNSATGKSFPPPPQDTKGFMDIPAEALKTNVYSNFEDKQSTNENEGVPSQQESAPITWNCAAQDTRGVVCEQPLSAQSNPKPVPGQGVGSQSRMDGTGSLPDELVSIIPEDLVRGVWNTARTFITRINQEMLSPTSNSEERFYPMQAAPTEESQSPASEQEHEQATQNTTEAPEVRMQSESAEGEVEMGKALQQLADMGFTNLEVNHRLLTKYNNDIPRAVAELIVLNCQ